MKLHGTKIIGCHVIQFKQDVDPRGLRIDAYNRERFEELGLSTFWPEDYVEINFKHTLKGLSFKKGSFQNKLLRCFAGSVYAVAVDLRSFSPTYRLWTGVHLSWEHPLGLYVPPGCASGIFVTSESAMVYYKLSDVDDPKKTEGIAWNDAELRIEWPIPTDVRPIISPEDQALPSMRDYLKTER